MPLSRLRAFATFALAASLCSAATVAQGSAPGASIPPGVSENLMNLADQPATHTGVVFDRSMMLSSISYDNYRYKEPAFYTPETMASIVETFHRAGWKHLVNGNQTPGNEAQPRTAITDVWLHFSGADIDHVTVLIRATRGMNLIQVAGDLRPLDLIHLSGHFGIPKVDPNAVMVPAPGGR
jgi:hypothetical protein